MALCELIGSTKVKQYLLTPFFSWLIVNFGVLEILGEMAGPLAIEAFNYKFISVAIWLITVRHFICSSALWIIILFIHCLAVPLAGTLRGLGIRFFVRRVVGWHLVCFFWGNLFWRFLESFDAHKSFFKILAHFAYFVPKDKRLRQVLMNGHHYEKTLHFF